MQIVMGVDHIFYTYFSRNFFFSLAPFTVSFLFCCFFYMLLFFIVCSDTFEVDMPILLIYEKSKQIISKVLSKLLWYVVLIYISLFI